MPCLIRLNAFKTCSNRSSFCFQINEGNWAIDSGQPFTVVIETLTLLNGHCKLTLQYVGVYLRLVEFYRKELMCLSLYPSFLFSLLMRFSPIWTVRNGDTGWIIDKEVGRVNSFISKEGWSEGEVLGTNNMCRLRYSFQLIP